MSNEQDILQGLREQIQKQIKDAYMEGAHQGAITTCAVLYGAMSSAGLEETHIFFDMLRDIAASHGCKDLKPVVEKLAHKNDN